jgi:hypothetical protein
MAGNPKQGFFLIEGAGQAPLVAVNQPDATVAQLLLLANGLGPRAYTEVRRIVSGIVELADDFAVGGEAMIQVGRVKRSFSGHSTRTWSAVPGTVVDADGRDGDQEGDVCAWLLQREKGGLIVVMPASYSMESIGTVMSSMLKGNFTLLRFEFGTVRTAPGIAASGTKVVVAPLFEPAMRRR